MSGWACAQDEDFQKTSALIETVSLTVLKNYPSAFRETDEVFLSVRGSSPLCARLYKGTAKGFDTRGRPVSLVDITLSPLFVPPVEEIESGSCCQALGSHCSSSAAPDRGRSAAGAAIRWAPGSHSGVVLGRRGSPAARWQLLVKTVMALCPLPRVTASAAPFAPLTDDPLPQPNGPHPGSNPRTSQSCECMCVFA